MLKLIDQDENHPYVEEFTKVRSVMFVSATYVLEGKADAKFSLGDIWNLFQEDALPNDASNFCRQMINCMELPTKNIRSSTEHLDYQSST